MKTIRTISTLRALAGAALFSAALSLYLVILNQCVRWFE